MPSPTRRQFLSRLCFGEQPHVTGGSDGHTLVCVFLRGGADTLNLVVPYFDDHYYRSRPTLAIAKPGSGENASVRLDDRFAFHPKMAPLLKPSAQFWRAALIAVRQGQPMPKLPTRGAATLTADADPRGASLAYRRAGRIWIRIDLADRLASHARKIRSAGGADPVDAALATSIGLDEEAIRRLMADIGFIRAGDAWRWRGRRPARQDRRAPASHAFAELAKLKKR